MRRKKKNLCYGWLMFWIGNVKENTLLTRSTYNLITRILYTTWWRKWLLLNKYCFISSKWFYWVEESFARLRDYFKYTYYNKMNVLYGAVTVFLFLYTFYLLFFLPFIVVVVFNFSLFLCLCCYDLHNIFTRDDVIISD